MARTVHRGVGRGATPQESRRAGALRAVATKLRLKALVNSGVRPEVVKAGWDLVKGRKLDTREAWFSMHETKVPGLAKYYQQLVMQAIKVETPADWRDEEWMWSWY